MEVINKHRKKLIVLGVIIEIILVPFIFKNVISLKNKNADNNISNINEVGKQEFGIMYRDNDTDSYKSYNGSIVDAINNRYVLNVGNSKCSDGSGATVTSSSVLSISGSTVTIKSNKTVYCTLYFDKKKTITALDIVASKPKSLSPQDNQGGMYRYQGTSTLVNNNYICFGTDNKTTCTSDEDHYMYRILGITSSGEMKLIKQTPVKEGDNTVFSWYKQTGGEGSTVACGTAEEGFEQWPESLIYKRLNGLSNGTITGSGQSPCMWGTDNNINANTNIFVDGYTNEYPYMKKTSDWYKMISDHNWIYGRLNDDIYDSNKIYQIETGQIATKYTYLDKSQGVYVEGTYTWNPKTDTVQAKIGLPYIHDLLLTYYDGTTEVTRGNQNELSLSNTWILKLSSVSGSNIVTMTSQDGYEGLGSGRGPGCLCMISHIANDSGNILTSCSPNGWSQYTRGLSMYPTFYLSNTVEMEGSGLETDPYRIVN